MENGTPIITTEHFKFGSLPNSKEGTPQVSAADYSRLSGYILQKDDIVFSRVGSVDINALVEDSQHSWLFSGRVLRVRSFENINSLYLHYELSTTRVKNSVISRAVGQTMPSINTEILKNTMVSLPRYFEEQQKIGSLFKHLDNTIALHQRKLDKLKRFKHGYLQQLFPKNGEKVPRVRFANFDEDWEQSKLGELLTKNSKKNKDLNVTNVESVSNKTGFTKQTEQFEDYSVASADLSNYYVITEKQFAYNPSRINVGSIAYKTVGDDKSVVSPLYVSFSTKNMLDDGYLWNWFKTTSFQSQRKRLSEGGVRDTLSFNQLSETSINVPEYLEQEKIGSFFKQMDDTLSLHQSKLDELKSIKQSLLQKMFI